MAIPTITRRAFIQESKPSTANYVANAIMGGMETTYKTLEPEQNLKIASVLNNAKNEINIKQKELFNEYESDPYNENINTELRSFSDNIFAQARESINPMFRGAFDRKSKEIMDSYANTSALWAQKQQAVNVKNDMKNVADGLVASGYTYGENFDIASAEADFESNMNALLPMAQKYLGTETTKRAFDEFKQDYLEGFAMGAIENDPFKAEQIIRDPEFIKKVGGSKARSLLSKLKSSKARIIKEQRREALRIAAKNEREMEKLQRKMEREQNKKEREQEKLLNKIESVRDKLQNLKYQKALYEEKEREKEEKEERRRKSGMLDLIEKAENISTEYRVREQMSKEDLDEVLKQAKDISDEYKYMAEEEKDILESINNEELQELAENMREALYNEEDFENELPESSEDYEKRERFFYKNYDAETEEDGSEIASKIIDDFAELASNDNTDVDSLFSKSVYSLQKLWLLNKKGVLSEDDRENLSVKIADMYNDKQIAVAINNQKDAKDIFMRKAREMLRKGGIKEGLREFESTEESLKNWATNAQIKRYVLDTNAKVFNLYTGGNIEEASKEYEKGVRDLVDLEYPFMKGKNVGDEVEANGFLYKIEHISQNGQVFFKPL